MNILLQSNKLNKYLPEKSYLVLDDKNEFIVCLVIKPDSALLLIF